MASITVSGGKKCCNWHASLAIIILGALIGPQAYSESTVLQGSVEENAQAQLRIHRFEGIASKSDNDQRPTRIHRSAKTEPEPANVDPETFAMKPAEKYDLEAEANSRELMLAWELWHKQLTKAVYDRCTPRGIGACAYRITVTRTHRLTIKVLRTWGDPMVRQNVVAAATSLDGNLGLSFPEGSIRQVAYDTHVMLCGPNIKPGYDWDKSDFEKIRQSW